MSPKRKAPEGPFIDPRDVLALFRKVGKPLNRAEIVRGLKLFKRDKEALFEVLDALTADGKLIRIKGGAFGLTERMRMLTGRLEVQRSGVGFVIPEEKGRADIFVRPENFGGAWHGDRVAVALSPQPPAKGKSGEGRIVRVLERSRNVLPVRAVREMGAEAWLCRPTDPKFDFGIVVRTPKSRKGPKLVRGHVLLAAPGERVEPYLWEGELLKILGAEEDAAVQEAVVKANQKIPTAFPEDALAQAAALPQAPGPEDFAGRRDLRDLDFVTIDGATAKDFDDAIHVARTRTGYTLWVAIADVSHYAAEGSPLDREAESRGNSYYFPRSVEPMFPESLSNGLCSLKPQVPRLAMAVRMDLTAGGKARGYEIHPVVIRSRARLTYDQVHAAVLLKDEAERKALGDILPMLEKAETLTRRLNARRKERGSLDFDLPEPEIRFSPEGETVDIRRKVRNFAHQIIEEFMIAANEAVAEFLTNRDLPCLYRVHQEPDTEKLNNLYKLTAKFAPAKGKSFPTRPDEITPLALQELLAAAEGSDAEFVINRLVLRSMKQARYEPDNIGHFGLASECYCHFTSPIRRYADLVVHRLVKAALRLGDRPIPGRKRLGLLGDHLGERERAAMEAEREILKRLTVLFLRDKIGQEFGGVISGVTDFGFFVELKEIMADGLVRLSSMTDDYYGYFADHEMLVGERTGRAFRLGQAVKVRLAEVSLDRLEVTLTLVAGGENYKKYV